MSVLFLLVPLAILLVAVFVGAYVWSARSGQFDDLTTPAMRAVQDDASPSSRQRSSASPEPPAAR
ncbi:MAG: cbb3-type cytochrome oxidase assembly protein CcoS [Gemmatimonadaceae bacterium]|nr:cbb3-type cytochrome oxidase assembly protein CcoS [Gemmatimonadaceae bacterium]